MKGARSSPWPGVAAIGLIPILLVGAVGVGINLPKLSAAAALPRGGLLDYSRAPHGGFAPLRNAFIEEALGITLPGSVRGPGGTSAAEPNASVETVGVSSTGRRAQAEVDVAPLSNDDFDHAYEAPPVGSRSSFTARTSTAGAGREPDEPAGCGPLGEDGGSVWFRYRPSQQQLLTADTFGSDHALSLAVFSGERLDDLQRVGCAHDARGGASVGFTAVPETTYHFQVAAPVGGGLLVFHLGYQAVTTRASIGPAGEQPDDKIEDLAMSPNGRFVAFTTPAGNLGWGGQDPDGSSVGGLFDSAICAKGLPRVLDCRQVYLRDRLSHETELVSLTYSGRPAPLGAFGADASNDGCTVSFYAHGEGITPGSPSGLERAKGPDSQVYVRDRCRGTTELVSVGVDGRYADRGAVGTGTTATGRYVFFLSQATNLVAGGIDDDGDWDVFRRDRRTGTTEQVSLSSSGAQQDGTPSQTGAVGSFQGAASWNGRFALFRSASSNLVEDDDNRMSDVFLRDMRKGTTTRVSVSTEERQANGEPVNAGGSVGCAVSNDGRYVLFVSSATNLVPNDTNGIDDLFLRDTRLGTTTRVSVSSEEEQAEVNLVPEDPVTTSRHAVPSALTSNRPTGVGYALSPDGRFAVFSSTAENLVEGDDNGVQDVFLRDLRLGTTTRVSLTWEGAQQDLWSSAPRISAGGRFIAFTSPSGDVVRGDTNGFVDAFVRERPGTRGGFSGWR